MRSNVLLALVSATVTWLLLELLVVPRLLPFTPLRIHAGLPRALRPLAQSSKATTVPRHYIALLGDSHAQGAGDWLLSVDANRNPAYYSAHLLHELTGRDVISFGASGAGSLRAQGTEPEAFVDYLQRTWRFRLPDPEQLLFYFYEGNDLQDNLRDLDHTYFGGGFDPARIRDAAYFRDFVQRTAPERTPVAEELVTWHWTDNLFLARFVGRVLRALVDRSWRQGAEAREFVPGEVNRAAIGGEERRLPDALQAPPLELTQEEIDLALWADAEAFALLRERFAGVPVLVVYLPSPLSTYRITSSEVDIQVQRSDGPSRFSRDRLAASSDSLCRAIEEITHGGGGAFLDLRPFLWETALEQPVHGPRDWKHLNRLGQERLASAVAAALGGGGERACASLARHFADG